MIEHDREWLALHYAPLAVLFPDDPAYRRPLAHDPAFQREQRRAAGGTISHSARALAANPAIRSEEHTSELQSLMRTSYAGFCLNKNTRPSITSHLDYSISNTQL